MLHELFLILILLLVPSLLILLIQQSIRENRRLYTLALGCLGLCLLGYQLTPATEGSVIEIYHPPVIAADTGLQLGLWAQTQLPAATAKYPAIQWLRQTKQGRNIKSRPISIFRQAEATAFRRRGIQRYFQHRHGWKDALNQPFEPRVLIIHSTEGESEQDAFEIFDRSTRAQYLGGTWTHFSVDQQGRIFQYGPLNRISKGQAGLDDQALGIEIVGTASLWRTGQQSKVGSIIQRWQHDRRQLQAVADLIQTLQSHYKIPDSQIFSHQELGSIRDLTGLRALWLKRQIRDRVYLGLEPMLDKNLQPTQWLDFLSPYDREDPGQDVMQVLKNLTQ